MNFAGLIAGLGLRSTPCREEHRPTPRVQEPKPLTDAERRAKRQEEEWEAQRSAQEFARTATWRRHSWERIRGLDYRCRNCAACMTIDQGAVPRRWPLALSPWCDIPALLDTWEVKRPGIVISGRVTSIDWKKQQFTINDWKHAFAFGEGTWI